MSLMWSWRKQQNVSELQLFHNLQEKIESYFTKTHLNQVSDLRLP